MNALIKKIFPIGLMLLLNACAHYSGSYYPDSVSYGGGYTVIERDYYRSSPDYGHYRAGEDHFHDAYRPRWQVIMAERRMTTIIRLFSMKTTIAPQEDHKTTHITGRNLIGSMKTIDLIGKITGC